MQQEANQINNQMNQNVRIYIAKTKVYAHQARVSDTVPICIYWRMDLVEPMVLMILWLIQSAS